MRVNIKGESSRASWFVIAVFLLSSSHASFVRVLRLGPRPCHFQMSLDFGVLLRQTERGLVNIVPGRPRPQPRERPGLRVVLTGYASFLKKYNYLLINFV